jgi:hypothetical protein
MPCARWNGQGRLVASLVVKDASVAVFSLLQASPSVLDWIATIHDADQNFSGNGHGPALSHWSRLSC